MPSFVQPLIVAILLWWLSTGVILWLIGLPRRTFKWTALGATVLMGAATVALLALRDATGVGAAYAGFAIGLALWAWHEVMFLLGYISGPRKGPCPPNLDTWPRFKVSTETVIHHELAIAIHAVLILLMTWGAANQVAAWTFLVLWGMRLSAKLIVFFGAPNIADGFLPSHLEYLRTYFQKRSMTAFFPMAITIVTSAAAAITYQAAIAPAGSFQSVGLLLVAGLAALAVIEHWALVLPLPDAALWNWAMRGRNSTAVNEASSEWRQ
ncbi:MAG: putative photosynthetic complex assembly protein PuhE [Hyphococcus sp.]